jgi:hypothetical protein
VCARVALADASEYQGVILEPTSALLKQHITYNTDTVSEQITNERYDDEDARRKEQRAERACHAAQRGG